MGHESLKEIWKNIHFENLRADFLKKRCQNSIRQTSPKMMHFRHDFFFNWYYVIALDSISI